MRGIACRCRKPCHLRKTMLVLRRSGSTSPKEPSTRPARSSRGKRSRPVSRERDYNPVIMPNAGCVQARPEGLCRLQHPYLQRQVVSRSRAAVVKRGDRVRIRRVNLGAIDHHPIHLHGHSFWVTQTDGGLIPAGARWPETTVLVSVGQSRTVELVADNPGDWAFHCPYDPPRHEPDGT